MTEDAGEDAGDPVAKLTARLREAAQEPFDLSKNDIGALFAEAADVIERLDNLLQAQTAPPLAGGTIY